MSTSGRRKSLVHVSSAAPIGKPRARKRKTLDPSDSSSLPFGNNVDIIFEGRVSGEEQPEDTSNRRLSKIQRIDPFPSESLDKSLASSRPVRKAARNSLVGRRQSARLATHRRYSMAGPVDAATDSTKPSNSSPAECSVSACHENKNSLTGSGDLRRLSLPAVHRNPGPSSLPFNDGASTSSSNQRPATSQPLEDVTISLLNSSSRSSKISSPHYRESVGSNKPSSSASRSQCSSRASSCHSELSGSLESVAFSDKTANSSSYATYSSSRASLSQGSDFSSQGSGINHVEPLSPSTAIASPLGDGIEIPRSVTPDLKPLPLEDAPLSVNESQSSPASSQLVISSRCRGSPLPSLTWADREHVWDNMCRKEHDYPKDDSVLDKHPAIHQRMRAILLDWLCEVCEVYKLHRETYYLANDFIDRYLLQTSGIAKSHLQLLGITCLFMAAKLEEIYPPKLGDFAYVTDGACKEHEILEKEIIVLKILNWRLSPMTPIMWLNTYLQLLQEITRAGSDLCSKPIHFIIQGFSGETFVQITRLLDLCVLDTSSLNFLPSLVAAAAVSCFFGTVVASRVSGYGIDKLAPAQHWIRTFAMAVQEMTEPAPLKTFRGIPSDDFHNIQTKAVELENLEQVHRNIKKLEAEEKLLQTAVSSGLGRATPQSLSKAIAESVLTPPKTDEKREGEEAEVGGPSPSEKQVVPRTLLSC